jgi:hypothetical protein
MDRVTLRRRDQCAIIKSYQSLRASHPDIALRVRWKDCQITGLRAGQAFIGDWRMAGLDTEAEYRHAKKILTRCELVTFRGTNKGTIATLVSPRVYSISEPSDNGQISRPVTYRQRSDSGPETTNHPDTQIDGDTATTHIGDSNSTPDGMDLKRQPEFMRLEEAMTIAHELHEAGRRDYNSPLGVFPREEIESWVKDWHIKYEATGGVLNGSKIMNPKAALESYLRSCSHNQPKRFKEMRGSNSSEDLDPPF